MFFFIAYLTESKYGLYLLSYHKLKYLFVYFFCVTQCRWSAKQTIPLSVLARNQTKGLDSRSRRDQKEEENACRELDKGTQRRELATGDAEWRLRVDTGEQKWLVAWDRVQQQWGKTGQDGLAFLVAL